jgi:hypothetical protein
MTRDVFRTTDAAPLIAFFAGESTPFRTLIDDMRVQYKSTPRADDLATNGVTDHILVAAIGAAYHGLGVVMEPIDVRVWAQFSVIRHTDTS